MDDGFLGLLGAILSVVIGIAAVIYVAVFTVADARADRSCTMRGWPNHNVTFTLTSYCVKRINQTDSVVPLSALKH